jgi:hypothetical protein
MGSAIEEGENPVGEKLSQNSSFLQILQSYSKFKKESKNQQKDSTKFNELLTKIQEDKI